MADTTPRRKLLDAFVLNLRRINGAPPYHSAIGAVATAEPGQLDPERVEDGLAVYIERAMEGRQQSWPAGFSQPVYQAMEPLRAPAGADWIGALLRYTTSIPTLNR